MTWGEPGGATAPSRVKVGPGEGARCPTPAAGPGPAGPIVPSFTNTIFLGRGFPVGAPPQPRMDNFAASCGHHLPLRPRHCNPLQSRHVRPSAQAGLTPPAGYAIQVRMPATSSQPRMLTGGGKMPRTVSKGTNGAVPGVSHGCKKGSRYNYFVCVQQMARLRNVAGPRTGLPFAIFGSRQAGGGLPADRV